MKWLIAGVIALLPILRREDLGGLMIRGEAPLRPGRHTATDMEAKIKAAMDPDGKFPPLHSTEAGTDP